MENFDLNSIGAGLAILAFWGFIASVSVAGIVAAIWDGIRKREAQHETVRRLIESDQTIDHELVDKLLSRAGGGNKRLHRCWRVVAGQHLAFRAALPGISGAHRTRTDHQLG